MQCIFLVRNIGQKEKLSGQSAKFQWSLDLDGSIVLMLITWLEGLYCGNFGECPCFVVMHIGIFRGDGHDIIQRLYKVYIHKYICVFMLCACVCLCMCIKQIWLDDNNWRSGKGIQEFFIPVLQLSCKFETIFKLRRKGMKGERPVLQIMFFEIFVVNEQIEKWSSDW